MTEASPVLTVAEKTLVILIFTIYEGSTLCVDFVYNTGDYKEHL